MVSTQGCKNLLSQFAHDEIFTRTPASKTRCERYGKTL